MLAAAQLQRRQHSGHEPSARLEAPSGAHPPLMFSHWVSKSGNSTQLIHSTCFFRNRLCHMQKYLFVRTKTSVAKLIRVSWSEVKWNLYARRQPVKGTGENKSYVHINALQLVLLMIRCKRIRTVASGLPTGSHPWPRPSSCPNADTCQNSVA